MYSEAQLRTKIRAELPPELFRRRPRRALLVIPIVAGIIGGSVALAVTSPPWYIALLAAFVLGNAYGSLMLLGHEIGHGATVRSHRLQDAYMYFTGAVYCLSPHLWRVWHGQVHHPNANIDGRDPDNFGMLEAYDHENLIRRYMIRTAPGSGNWLSGLYPFLFFTLQAQGVLLVRSKEISGFNHLRRRRAVADTIAMTLFWITVCVLLGLRGSLFVVLIPMLIANFSLMCYIITNHMLRPLTETSDILNTTISVTTLRFLDFIHFNFSHHVEHHLFPGTPGSAYPQIRQSLRRIAGDQYLAPAHWWAFVLAFRTPKLYESPRVVVEPSSGRRVQLADVETQLREMLS
ncbi:fatty acid desaturase (plasmid) [Streptomyces virginiae]|uniref:fatty acid desaturase family protein n=1 Tax=Streptomyces virginiae TaxID=1961 RepID=UPI002F91B185